MFSYMTIYSHVLSYMTIYSHVLFQSNCGLFVVVMHNRNFCLNWRDAECKMWPLTVV